MRRASARARRRRCGRGPPGSSGTSGTTSAAPTRGWTPSCSRRSMQLDGGAMPARRDVDEAVLVPDERVDRAVVVGVGVDVEQRARVARTPRRSRATTPRRAPRRRWARPRARSVPYEAVREEDPRAPRRASWRTFVRLLGFLRPVPRLAHRLVARSRSARRSPAILVPVLTGVVINELDGDPDTRGARARDRRDHRARASSGRAHVRTTPHLGPAGARRRVRPSRRALLALPPALVRLLRPQPDGAAHVARDDRPPVRALLPRLRAHLLRPARRDDRRRHAVLFFYSWKLALIALAITPIIVARRVPLQPRVAARPARRPAEARRGLRSSPRSRSPASTSSSRSRRRSVARSSFASPPTRSSTQTLAANRQRALYVPLLTFLPLVAQARVLLVAGRMVVSGSLSLGRFFAFNLLLAMLVMPLRMLGMWVGQAQRAIAAGERIFEILDEPEEIADRPTRRRCRRARGRRASRASTSGTSQDGPCSRASTSSPEPAGRSRSSGAPGSGKTTLAALVPRFYDATAGRVLVDGVDVRELAAPLAPPRDRRHLAGPVPLLRDRSATTSRSGCPTRRTRRSRRPPARRRPTSSSSSSRTGYETVVGERGITLSGGQRQRIAIARALLIDPRILILDDATASVDATTEARIRAGLREVMRGRTTIIIAHRLSTIALADEIVVLDHGRIAARGTQAELLDDEPGLPRDPRARAAPAGGRGMSSTDRHTFGTKPCPTACRCQRYAGRRVVGWGAP